MGSSAPVNEAQEEKFHEEEIVEEPKKAEIPPLDEPEPKTAENSITPQQKVYSLIKELDNGNGAEFESVIEKSGCEDAEKIISRLLMEGEIFELGKGRLKVLE